MRTHTLDGNEPSNKEIREHFERLSATRFRVERQMVAMLLDRQTAMLDALRGCVQALETHIADEARRAMLVPNVLCPCTDHELATARTILARIEGEK